jgi:hypothetical protein
MHPQVFILFISTPSAKQCTVLAINQVLGIVAVFPVRIKWRDPIGLGGANNCGSCRGDDGHDYVLKDSRVHPLTPHNEWFCTKLAEEIGVACPPCAIIHEDDGNEIFGSRWEGGVTNEDCCDLIGKGGIPADSAFASLSRILAFDHFIYNKDRSTANYIVRNSKSRHVIMAIDFDDAWLRNGFPLPDAPFHRDANTRYYVGYLKQRIGEYVMMHEVNSILDRLSQVSVGTVGGIIASQPDNWLSTDLRKEVLSWWASQAMFDRIEAIRRGIGDGTFL